MKNVHQLFQGMAVGGLILVYLFYNLAGPSDPQTYFFLCLSAVASLLAIAHKENK
jgi:hypothetical protein